MSERQEHEIGAALRTALEVRGCALSANEARALSVLLIGLIGDGLLACDTDTPVHGGAARPQAEPGGDAVGRGGTAPAYNMGQSICIRDDSE